MLLATMEVRTMTFKELAREFRTFQGKTVVFQGHIEDCETCFDMGQKAVLSQVIEEVHECVKIYFDFSTYIDFNRIKMKPNFYDDNGRPILTAEESGMLPIDGVESYYFEGNDTVEKYFTILEENAPERSIASTIDLLNDAIRIIRKYNKTHPSIDSETFLQKVDSRY
jgi:hypothetical protein